MTPEVEREVEREVALELALKTLGFGSKLEYAKLLAKVKDGNNPDFKTWQSNCGFKSGLIEVLRKQGTAVCLEVNCDFCYNYECENPTWDTEKVIPCWGNIN